MENYLGEIFVENYLGEEILPLAQTPYANYSSSDWVLKYIEHYGQIEGSHHKTWVLDQIARILKGTPVIVSKASWRDGTVEWRFTLGDPSGEYLAWVEEMKCDGDYDYDEGIAP